MNHYALHDEEFELQFSRCTLDPIYFDHEAHIRMSWLYIRKYGKEEAKELISKQILAFTRHLGEEEKYDETLTKNAVELIARRMKRTKADSFQKFIREFSELKTNFHSLLKEEL